MNPDKVWIVIPAYNEGKNISGIIDGVKNYSKHILVVDDGSKDNTFDIAQSKGISILKHIVNLGKGAALKTGCDYSFKHGAEAIVAIDADAQHDPSEIPHFLDALENVDIVFGYRKLSGKMPFVFRFGNWFINQITKVLYGISLKDTQCGYRAFTKDAYSKIRWRASDYSMESEMVTRAGKYNLKYEELPIQTVYPDRYKGTTIIDGIKIVFNLLVWRLTR